MIMIYLYTNGEVIKMYKNKKMLSSFLVLALVLMAIALSGCVEEDVNKIIIGTSADFPPFEYTDTDGTIIGFDIEMVTKILTDAGYTVEVQDISFDSLIASLQAEKIDVIAAAMTITVERDEQIDFSDPYYEADQSVLIMTDSGVEINESDEIEDFKTSIAGLTIGAQTGTTGASWVQENLVDTEMMDEDNFNQYETYTLAILDLENRNIDIIVLDKPVAQAFAEDEDMGVAYTIITEESYGLGVREGDTELLADINEGLADLIGSEDWTELVKKYFE